MTSPVPAADEHQDLRGPDRFPCLDAYRAIAMLMVMVFHVYFVTRTPVGHAHGVFGPFLARGDVGVAVFLVLSAFLLYRPYFLAQLQQRPSRSTGRFYRHRVLRILPGYWLALAVVVIVFGISFSDPGQFLAYAGLLQVYSTHDALAPQFQPIYQAWSLAVEVGFYFLLPWLALGLRGRSAGRSVDEQVRAALGCTALIYLAGVGFRIWLVTADPSWARIGLLWLPNWLDVLAIGLALAILSARATVTGVIPPAVSWLAARPAVCWAIAFAILLAVTRLPLPLSPAEVSASEYLVRQFCYGLFAGFFLLPAMFGDQDAGVIRKCLRHPVMVYLGSISLGFYLLHLTFIRKAEDWTGRTFFNADFWTILAIALPLTLIAATLSHYLVERPFLAIRDRSPRAVAAQGLFSRSRRS